MFFNEVIVLKKKDKSKEKSRIAIIKKNNITAPKHSLIDLFHHSPFFGVEFNLPEREIEKTKKINM